MKKINVNKELCIGCGACVAIDNEHFDFDDNGKSNVISNENIDSDNLINAIESCPTSAISINDCECNDECDDNCQCNNECECDENCECGDDCHCSESDNCGCHKCNEEN